MDDWNKKFKFVTMPVVLNAPQAYVAWMNQHPGFNPRAQQSSNALSQFVLADLRVASPAMDSALDSGRLKERVNAEVFTNVVSRNVDLILHLGDGTPTFSVLASVENKTIMAAHGKTRKNRFGDLIAYSNHMHNHRKECIAAGILIINISASYKNPDPFAKGMIRQQLDMNKVVADTVRLFGGMPLRTKVEEPSDQLEALAVIVVDYDGTTGAKLITVPPAPQPGEPIHYESFINRIAQLYHSRFIGIMSVAD